MTERLTPQQAMTTRQLAEHLQIHWKTVIRHVHEDGWPYSMIGNRFLFTPPQIKQIYALIEVKPEPPTARLRRIRGDTGRKPRAS